MCSWFSLPEGRTNPLIMSLTRLSGDRNALLGKDVGEAVTPEGLCSGFPGSCAQLGLEGEELSLGSHPDMSDSRWTPLVSHSNPVSLTGLSTDDRVYDQRSTCRGNPLQLKWSFHPVLPHCPMH